ncbi:MAG TPA: hypothetical protein VGN51_10605 [Acidimicrobiia bacterium]
MTDLVAHGIDVSLPAGWEGRLFRRPLDGEVASADASIEGEPAAPQETTNAVLHASTIAIPAGVGDFASGAVDKLGDDDIFVVLFEYDPASVDTPLFERAGLPRTLAADDFSPNVMQRAIRGQAGVQRFFNDQGRAFCLYVVIGSFARRRDLVKRVNTVLATLTIDPLDATAGTTPTSTTVPATSSAPTTDAPTTTVAPTTTTPPDGDAP